MKEKDKKLINAKNNILYFEYKIECNNKYIEYLKLSNEINLEMIKIYEQRINTLNDEEIEVLK